MKKNKRLSIFSLLICTLLISLLTACGGNPKSLSGRYEAEGSAQFKYIEFFSDGKYTSSHTNYEGSYSIDGNRIRLEGILVDSRIYYFKTHGKTLELSYDEDFKNSDIYVRKD